MRSLVMLAGFQVRNAILQLLRDPRRLIPAVLMVSLWIGGESFPWSRLEGVFASPEAGKVLLPWIPVIRTSVFLLLAILMSGEIDRACVSAALEFSRADIDYLFPSPVSRRHLLAARLPLAGLFVVMITAVLAFGFSLIWLPLQEMLPGRHAHGAWTAALAAAFCFGGYANIAIAIELFCVRRTGRIIRACLIGATVVVLGAIGLAWWQNGIDGLGAVAANPFVTALFYPCRLCADAALNPLTGGSNVAQTAGLGLFFVATFVLLFTRRANYYEAAMLASERVRLMRTASIAEQAIAPGQAGMRRKGDRPYTIPEFGRGPWAIAWAHLAAAAKQPWLNFVLPVIGGALLVVLSRLAPYPRRDFVLGMCVLEFCVLVPAAMAQMTYQRSMRRMSLMKALPVPGWQAVLAEVLSRVVRVSLAFLGIAGALLAFHHPYPLAYVPLLLIALPVEIFCLDMVMYGVVLCFPSSEDKIQAIQAGFVAIMLNIAILSVQGMLPRLAVLSGVSHTGSVLVGIAGVLGAAALAVSFTTRLYRTHQPGLERGLMRTVERLPEPDEAVVIALLMPWLVFYVLTILAVRFPGLQHADPLVIQLACQFGLMFFPVLLWARFAGLRWRPTFSWRPAATAEMAGAAMMGAGVIPWFVVLGALQPAYFGHGPRAVLMYLSDFLPALTRYPILAPVVLAVAAGFCEEMVYRGPVLAGLRRSLSPRAAVFASGAIFAACHFDAGGMIDRTLLGALLAWIVLRTGSIFPAMLLHAVFDFGLFAWYSALLGHYGPAALDFTSTHLSVTLLVGAVLVAAGLGLLRTTWRSRRPAEPRVAVAAGA
ncbi:MAG: putative ABC exporter domain-containing protein [Capsulimonadaceae bacterium]